MQKALTGQVNGATAKKETVLTAAVQQALSELVEHGEGPSAIHFYKKVTGITTSGVAFDQQRGEKCVTVQINAELEHPNGTEGNSSKTVKLSLTDLQQLADSKVTPFYATFHLMTLDPAFKAEAANKPATPDNGK